MNLAGTFLTRVSFNKTKAAVREMFIWRMKLKCAGKQGWEGNDTPKTLVAMGHLKKQESIRPGGIV